MQPEMQRKNKYACSIAGQNGSDLMQTGKGFGLLFE